MNNNKKKPARKSLLKYFLLLGFLWEFLGLVEKKEKLDKIEDNFKEYLKEEEAEIEDYIEDKEGFSKFIKHSGKLISEFFIPCHSNNHKPKLLRTQSLTLIVVILALLKVTIALYIFYFTAYQAKMSEDMTAQILALVNRDRTAQNLKPLSLNTVLNSSALSKANNMVANNYFAHYSPDGKKPWDFIDRNSYAYLFVGENLAMNFTSAESAHQALMLSPSHKENIMNDKYLDIGLAVVSGEIAGKNTNVLVELFAVKAEIPVKLVLTKEMPKVKSISSLAKAEVSPNSQIESNQLTQVKSFDNIPDKDIINQDKRMALLNNFMLGMMAFLFIALIINIIIKAEIQHKPVIVQTMLAIICLTGLIYLNFNFLENVLPKLFVV